MNSENTTVVLESPAAQEPTVPTCPGCGQRVKEHWQVCPHCYTRLKKPCTNCRQLLELSWQICPKIMNELTDESDPERARRVFEAMLRMKKLDIAQLKAAA